MKYLFATEGLKTLETFCWADTLYAFDFDGTLAGIVDNPSQACMAHPVSSLLRWLNQAAPVAIISGRSLPDLHSLLNFSPAHVIGNHGLEGLQGVEANKDRWKKLSQAWKKQLSQMLPEAFTQDGVRVEDKIFSLAIHYRASQSPQSVKLALNQIVERLSPPPRMVLGKQIINLLPEGEWHKGMALVALMRQIGSNHAIYVGDDDTDEDVFSLEDSRVLSIRVGFCLNSQADFFLHKQPQIRALLRYCLRFIKSKEKEEKKPAAGAGVKR